jgi:hypothetical protein
MESLMTNPDLRSRLRAIADGNGEDELPNSLSPIAVAKHAKTFRAWVAFANSTSGEPLTAPAELLPPLH